EGRAGRRATVPDRPVEGPTGPSGSRPQDAVPYLLVDPATGGPRHAGRRHISHRHTSHRRTTPQVTRAREAPGGHQMTKGKVSLTQRSLRACVLQAARTYALYQANPGASGLPPEASRTQIRAVVARDQLSEFTRDLLLLALAEPWLATAVVPGQGGGE